MLNIDFHKIAIDAVSRGFAVIPLQPGSKDPDMSLIPRVNNEPGTGGAARRTRDPKQIEQWAQASPNANVGVCSDESVTILESDDEQRFRQLVRDVSRTLYGESRELPPTLTSQARPGRPHFFFLTTPKTKTVEESPGIQGLFEWRHKNQYVVGPGSLHPTGVVYQLVNDVPMVPMPDWLVAVLLEIRQAYRGQDSRVSKFVRVGPAAIARDALLNSYNLDPKLMLEDADFNLHVGAGERHYFLQSIAGLLHDGTRTEDELAEILLAFRDRYCEGGKSDYEVENIASWTIRQQPSDIEPNLPAMIKNGTIYSDGAEFAAAPPELKTADDFQWRYPAVAGKTKEYVLEPKRTFDGWFPRGRPSLLAGASGSGKSTFMLDMLYQQSLGQYVLGHRGARLRYLVLFADRGALANEETLERLGLLDKKLPIDYLNPNLFGIHAAESIKESIENYEEAELPQVVFVEGGDMLVEKPNDAVCVAQFMTALQKIAQHYHIAIVLSVGAPKKNKDNAVAQRRDMVVGSQMWSRNADSVIVITSEEDGTSQYRKLTAQHRNEATESFDLQFKEGKLVEVQAPKGAVDVVKEWMLATGTFTRAEAAAGMKEAGVDMSPSQVNRRIAQMVKAGELMEGLEGKKVFLKVVVQ